MVHKIDLYSSTTYQIFVAIILLLRKLQPKKTDTQTYHEWIEKTFRTGQPWSSQHTHTHTHNMHIYIKIEPFLSKISVNKHLNVYMYIHSSLESRLKIYIVTIWDTNKMCKLRTISKLPIHLVWHISTRKFMYNTLINFSM